MTATLHFPQRLPLALHIRLFATQAMAVMQGHAEDARNAEARFNELFRTNNNLIASICLSFSRTKEDFEDLRQDALLNIWNGMKSFRGESLPSTWVYRVVLNTCVSHRRKSQVSQKEEETFNAFYRELFEASPQKEVEDYEQMYRLISGLPPIDKSVLLMWLDEKKYEDIAAVTGLSRDAVASRLKRIKDRLAEKTRKTTVSHTKIFNKKWTSKK